MSPITLHDGRDLEVEVSGPDGAPVLLFCHGTPGASTQFGPWARGAAARGLRLVTWSRPGYGASTRRAGRTVADDVDDAAAVLDQLGVDTCLVAGLVGRGTARAGVRRRSCPTACGACCASPASRRTTPRARLPGRHGRGQRRGVRGGAEGRGRPCGRGSRTPGRSWSTSPPTTCGLARHPAPPVDEAALTGEFAEHLATEFRQAVSVGVDGWLDDDLAFTRPWGFDLGASRCRRTSGRAATT